MPYWLYLLSVWLHIMAAVVWIGGTIFLVSALVPAIRQPEFASAAPALIRWTGVRFRRVGWICFVILIITGTLNLLSRGIGWQELSSTEFWQSSFGALLAFKLSTVGAIILISALHDFSVGPRAIAAWHADSGSVQTLSLRRQAIRLGRVNLLCALIATVLGVFLVRGFPW